MQKENIHQRTFSIHQIYRYIIGLSIFSSIFLFQFPLSIQAKAQSPGIDLTINPPLKIATMNGTQPVHLSFTISNNGSIDLEATPSVYRFHSDNLSGQPVIENTKVQNTTIDTPGLSIDKPFLLAVGHPVSFVLTITPLPQEQNDIQATLLISTESTSQNQLSGSNTKLKAVIGSNIIIKNQSHSSTPLSIDSITSQRVIDMFSPIKVVASAKNSDISATQLHGVVEIKESGELIPLYPDLILGQSNREVRGLSIQNKINTPIETQFNRIHLPGIYHIHFIITSESGQSREATKEIIILPLTISALLFLVILILLVIVTFLRRRKIL